MGELSILVRSGHWQWRWLRADQPQTWPSYTLILEQRSHRDGVFARRTAFFVWLILCSLHLVSLTYSQHLNLKEWLPWNVDSAIFEAPQSVWFSWEVIYFLGATRKIKCRCECFSSWDCSQERLWNRLGFMEHASSATLLIMWNLDVGGTPDTKISLQRGPHSGPHSKHPKWVWGLFEWKRVLVLWLTLKHTFLQAVAFVLHTVV